jgi:hypothetical protein
MTSNRRIRSVAIGLGLVSLSLAVTAGPAKADDTVRWKTIIGIIQAGNVVGVAGTANAITGGGQPWSTLGGDASVDLATGKMRFSVRGLVLAGGSGIGVPPANTSVKGTLVCNPGAAQVAVDGTAVLLSAQGDASFSGKVVLDTSCLSPSATFAFLIRLSPANRWVANGAVLEQDTSDGN